MKKDIVYNKLREIIISGYFRPGENLSEREIAELLGVSRTPVREAFKRLELEGIVNYTPKKGVTIPSFDREQLTHIYNVREQLEGLAARLLAGKKENKDTLYAMRQNIERAKQVNDVKEQTVINGEFHELMAKGSENPYLINIYHNLRSAISLIRTTSLSYSDRLKTNLEEHIMICNAIESGKEDLAEKVTRRHIQNSMKSAISTLETKTNSIKIEWDN